MFKFLKSLWRKLDFYRLGPLEFARRLGVTIGQGCRIYTSYFGSEPFLISIGDRVTISSNVTFITHDGSTWLIRDGEGRRQHIAPIAIGNDVFVGHGVIILPGVKIGNYVVIGAGSVVTKSIPDNSVVAGNPAKRICAFDDFAARSFRHESEMRGANHEERCRSIATKDYKASL